MAQFVTGERNKDIFTGDVLFGSDPCITDVCRNTARPPVAPSGDDLVPFAREKSRRLNVKYNKIGNYVPQSSGCVSFFDAKVFIVDTFSESPVKSAIFRVFLA
jgi:hypothetical protein